MHNCIILHQTVLKYLINRVWPFHNISCKAFSLSFLFSYYCNSQLILILLIIFLTSYPIICHKSTVLQYLLIIRLISLKNSEYQIASSKVRRNTSKIPPIITINPIIDTKLCSTAQVFHTDILILFSNGIFKFLTHSYFYKYN